MLIRSQTKIRRLTRGLSPLLMDRASARPLIAIFIALLALATFIGTESTSAQEPLSYPIVDTGQTHCFSASEAIQCGTAFNGQDAQYAGLQPAYQINGDGTVTDLNTGLMWQQDPGPKVDYQQAVAGAASLTLGGYNDWRLPSIKELYSLMNFTGVDVSMATGSEGQNPFIDDDVFVFQYGDTSGGARIIDSQWATSTVYNSTVMNGQACFFGVNFADGRIKCYPTRQQGGAGGYFALYVRGAAYGINDFVDNGDDTITDRATGLTWMKNDSGQGLLWDEALGFCEGFSLGGFDDWRLPNIKELHSILDYSRSPDATNSPAIDPLFNVTGITNEAGQADYPFYWSSTTHLTLPNRVQDAAYIAFGRGLGYMEPFGGWIDVHGAGTQRTDPKTGVEPGNELGHGPQGDAQRAFNYVRCVRGGVAQPSSGDGPQTLVFPSSGGAAGQPPGGAGGQAPGGNAGQAPGQAPGNGQQGPPPEAFAACAGQGEGAACSVQTPNGLLNGVCRPVEAQLACVPN